MPNTLYNMLELVGDLRNTFHLQVDMQLNIRGGVRPIYIQPTKMLPAEGRSACSSYGLA